MKHKYTPIICIYGPTASGKTELSEKLGAFLKDFVFVNMDMGQLYQHLKIGTARPTFANNVNASLFGVIQKPCNVDAVWYRSQVEQAIIGLDENTIPILVGGSGFYLKNLLFSLDEIKKTNLMEKNNQKYSWELLQSIDPKRADMVHPNDFYRIKRSIDIYYDHGVMPSERKFQWNPIRTRIIIVWLNRNNDDLLTRIKNRYKSMINDGFEAEVADLMDQERWEHFLKEKKIIGYPLMIDYLKGIIDKRTRDEGIIHQTYAYAKRQMVFWKSLTKTITTYNQDGPKVTIFEPNDYYNASNLFDEIYQCIVKK